MEKGLSLLKYTLNTPTKSIFSREFSTTPVLGNFRNIFLNDYLNLQKYIQGFNYISTFIFKFGEDAVVVTKIHDKAVTEIKVNKEKYEKDFFELLKERYGVSITTGKWGSRILDIQKNPSINLNNFITDLNSKIEVVQDNKTDIEELKRAIFANKNEEEVSKIEKMIKSMKDILKYEKQIEDYQNSKTIAEDLRKKSTELANEKKQLEESINSIDLLTNSKKEIETKLATMGLSNSSLNINPSKEVIIQERMSKFKGLKKTQYNSINSVNDTTGKVLEGKVLIVFIGVQIILTLLLYLIEPDLNILLIGMLSILSLVVGLFVINTKNDKEVLMSFPLQDSGEVKKEEGIPNKDKILINSALYNAYKFELEGIEATIKKRLSGKSLEEVKSRLLHIEGEINETNSKIEASQDKLTPEEYYKVRRELDILKIDQESLLMDEKLNAEIEKIKEIANEENNISIISNINSKSADFINSLPIFILNLKDVSLVKDLKSLVLLN